MIEKEEWRDIPGYLGYYQISNLGRVKSLQRKIIYPKSNTYPNGCKHILKEKILTPSKDKKGYLFVQLFKNGHFKSKKIHRLVAEIFLNNEMNLPQVNHKDENKQNNNVLNLEWCTRLYNNLHGTRLERAITNGNKTRQCRKWRENHSGGNVHNARQVVGVNVKTGEVIEFESMTGVVEFLGIRLADRSVSATIRGRQKTAYGYRWYYKEDYEKISMSN